VLYGEKLADSGSFSGSEAHIIPSALGGRLKPRGILSQKGNSTLDQMVDNPFVEIFGHSLTYLLGVSRDRGKSTHTKLRDSAGTEWLVSLDRDSIEPARPTIRVDRLEGGAKQVEFSGTAAQLRPFLKTVGAEELTEQILSMAEKRSDRSPELHIGSRKVSAEVLRLAAWTEVALFAAYKWKIRSNEWVRYILNPPNANVLSSRARFAPGAVTFKGDFGALSHGIAVWNDPAARYVYGYVQTFGGIGTIVRFAGPTVASVKASYCVDPLTGDQGFPDFTVNFSANSFDSITEPTVEGDVDASFCRIASVIEKNTVGATRVVVSHNREAS
jgi:hypothetical protein